MTASPSVTVTVQTPTSIPLAKLQQWAEELGLPTTDLREFTLGPRGVYVEVYARNAAGKRYYDPGTGAAAVHRVAIPVDRSA